MQKNHNDEVMAAISAAIAAYNTGSGSKLIVRSIRRVPQVASVWNMTGRMDNVRNQLNG